MTNPVAISELNVHCLWLVDEVARHHRELIVLLSVISGWEVALLVQADMLTVATALHHGAPLLTNDERIGDTGLVRVIG